MKEYWRGEGCSPDNNWNDWTKNVEWVAYWYENYGYEGSGIAIVKYKDGKYWCDSMSHCSCYGPWEDAPHQGVETLEMAKGHVLEIGKGYGDERVALTLEALDEAIRGEKE